jgi:membrane fusion protein (multidrug efflux system)
MAANIAAKSARQRGGEPEVPAGEGRDRPVRDDAGGRESEPPKSKSDGAKAPRRPVRVLLRRHPFLALGAAVTLALMLVGALLWWLHARHYESTDDAFIDARSVPIASQVMGAIVAVPVGDNEAVPAGAGLVDIDPRDYQAAAAQAAAQIGQADATIANFDAQIDAQTARIDAATKQVVQAEAALTFSRQERARAQELLGRGAGTQQQAQQTASDERQKDAALLAAQANQMAAEKQVAVLQTQKQNAVAQLALARAAQAQAQANLTRTSIMAPESGRATKISAAVGGTAQPGQVLMMFVPSTLWVTANFKETQLALMRAGQPVDVSVDAYPGRIFHGHVDSIQAGSGAAFSLLPPENATGNYVKVVQRVPVKIVFDGPPDVHLGPGMSVVPTVKVR